VCLDGDVAGRAVTPELRVRLYDGSRRGREAGSLVHRRPITPIRYNRRQPIKGLGLTLTLRTDGRPMASATPPGAREIGPSALNPKGGCPM
jgi:hypothetical protein